MGDFIIPYMMPMMVGMTFNAYTLSPGVLIYPPECVNDLKVDEAPKIDIKYVVVNSENDRKEVMDLSGDLAMKIKSGLIDVAGQGNYVRNVLKRQEVVEILTRMEYKASTAYFKQDCKPVDNWWDLHPPSVLGTHRVSYEYRGAEMLASLRFVVHNVSDIESVKGSVKGVFGAGGTTEIAAEGKMEKLASEVKDKASLEISYYGTVPLKSIANDIKGFQELVNTFGTQVKEAGLEKGVPMKMQLTALSELAPPEHKDKFNFKKSSATENKLGDFESKMDELKLCQLNLTEWTSTLPVNLKKEMEQEIGGLLKNMTKVLEVFYDVSWKLNVSAGPEQLKPAYDAYGTPTRNKYNRQVQRLMARLDPLIKRDDVSSDDYNQYGNNKCTAKNVQTLYSGFVISSTEEGIGGMAQYDCVPSNPQKGYELEEKSTKSHLAGIRYTKIDDKINPFKGENAKKVSEKGVSCAKCFPPDSASVVTFSATESCPLTWVKMYSGYVMSARTGGHTTQYVCVDDTPGPGFALAPEEGSKDTMAFSVVTTDGSLPKETYVNNALMKCVVCSMKSNQIA